MSIKNYSSKLNDIIQLPQFEKVQLKRKNEKHTTLKEEERIVTALKKLKAVSYTHLRAHETDSYLVCRLLLEKKISIKS